MSIRGRLLILAFGAVVPLIIVGSVALWDLWDAKQEHFTPLMVFGLLALLCAVAAALLIARGITRPLDRLSATARRFGQGDFSARAPGDGNDELARLGAAFNSMAARLEEREQRFSELDRLKSEFVSSVSHELRTPLTTIKALTRLLLRGEASEAKRREYLETIAVECDRQIDLVLNLLDLSRIDAGRLTLNIGRADTTELLLSCLKSQQRAAEFRGHQLRMEQPVSVFPVRADQKALRRVIGNLIENAIKYTPDGGRIILAARSAGDVMEISVTDNGQGIHPRDIPHLFEKFHRGRPPAAPGGDRSTPEAEEAPGIGLGLYLAHNIIGQMGGRITVESEVGRGSVFTLYLPLWENGSGARSLGEEHHEQTAAGRG
ncbi:MAG: ATP-binding protein [Blastocatellales bacterium]